MAWFWYEIRHSPHCLAIPQDPQRDQRQGGLVHQNQETQISLQGWLSHHPRPHQPVLGGQILIRRQQASQDLRRVPWLLRRHDWWQLAWTPWTYFHYRTQPRARHSNRQDLTRQCTQLTLLCCTIAATFPVPSTRWQSY